MRASVRAACVAYLTAGKLPYVGTIFAARPEIIDEENYEVSMAGSMAQYVASPGGSAAVLIVNLPNSKRTRTTLTGRAHVDDFDIHEVVLELILANTPGDAVQAQQDHDAICDATTAWLRADPLLGTGGSPVWSAGEFKAGVDVQQSMPFTGADGTTVFIIGVLRFQAWENVVGPSGT